MPKPACCEYRPCVDGDAGIGDILFWIGSAGASKNAQRVGECAKTIAAFWTIEAGKAIDGENV